MSVEYGKNQRGSQQNASLVEQSTSASKSLLEQANHLEELMSFFKV
ncbi:hypothetical protein [Brachyspira hampsonii]|nr:hypothetical protein [Brachyspira hampsonii]